MTRFANENKYDAYIQSAATRYGVPMPVVKGLIAAESAYRESATRYEPHLKDASIGLMQILYKTAQGVGFHGPIETLAYPQINIEYGVKFFGMLFSRYGGIEEALAAYNSGSATRFPFDAISNGFRIARNADGSAVWYRFKKGEFGNQPYVTKVLSYSRQYGWTGVVPAVRGTIHTTRPTTQVTPVASNLPIPGVGKAEPPPAGGSKAGGLIIVLIAGAALMTLRGH